MSLKKNQTLLDIAGGRRRGVEGRVAWSEWAGRIPSSWISSFLFLCAAAPCDFVTTQCLAFFMCERHVDLVSWHCHVKMYIRLFFHERKKAGFR